MIRAEGNAAIYQRLQELASAILSRHASRIVLRATILGSVFKHSPEHNGGVNMTCRRAPNSHETWWKEEGKRTYLFYSRSSYLGGSARHRERNSSKALAQ